MCDHLLWKSGFSLFLQLPMIIICFMILPVTHSLDCFNQTNSPQAINKLGTRNKK